MSEPTIRAYIETLRQCEIRYRAEGEFESAVQAQQAADYTEATGKTDPSPAWFQRGLYRIPQVYVPENLVGFTLPNGLVWLLTEDAADYVERQLRAYLILRYRERQGSKP